jgi:radical SAM protein with 4Fe4S-binding SPASM domain
MSSCKKKFDDRIWNFNELPEIIFIESYFGCNLRCEMCPVPNKNLTNQRTFNAMTYEKYRLIIDQISEKSRRIHLNQLGEPLLNNEIVNFVKLAHEKNHIVGFTTNATKLTPELSKQLLLAGINFIIFSFDGAEELTYNSIRKGADFSKTKENIKIFCDLNKRMKCGCRTQVDCILSDLTEPEIKDIKNMWKGITHVNFIPLDDWTSQLKLPERFGLKRTPHDNRERYPCRLLWETMAISAEGNVMLCCHDFKQYSNLPNIIDKDIKSIWMEEIALERKKQVTKRIDKLPCLTCVAWQTMPKYHSPWVLRRIRNFIRFTTSTN